MDELCQYIVRTNYENFSRVLVHEQRANAAGVMHVGKGFSCCCCSSWGCRQVNTVTF